MASTHSFIRHLDAFIGHQVPAVRPYAYDYIQAANGKFIRAKRDLIEACLPLSDNKAPRSSSNNINRPENNIEPHFDASAYSSLDPYIDLVFGLVPMEITRLILDHSLVAAIPHQLEILFHLSWNTTRSSWIFTIPAQHQSHASVYPIENGLGSSYANSIIEAHSHHEMSPQFSARDDADETGFKIYSVIGNVISNPSLRTRLGIYGHLFEIPSSSVFELPEGLCDAFSGRQPAD